VGFGIAQPLLALFRVVFIFTESMSSRVSGILLHPTSFPGRFGIGELGLAAHQFIDFLYESGQQLWQVLPLGPAAYGNSPYMCYSSMAGNPLLISLELLQEQGLLEASDLESLPHFPEDSVDYERVIEIKMPLLVKAAETFKTNASEEEQSAYAEFCQHAFWLDNYALFMALKGAHDGMSWNQWGEAIAQRQPEAMVQWQAKLSDEIFHHKFFQFEFFRQWSELKAYANEKDIQIIGDIPIYVAHDSADVWAYPENFHLDPETGEPALMAGVPPDYFSETGQLWGNPIYDWEKIQASGFKWWIQRVRALLDYVDWVRIDHFRGFSAYWAVPKGETTAINGEWMDAPGTEFFEALFQELGKLPILAEDLGVITPDVEELRDRFHFPGMKVLHFAFGSDAGNPFLPYNHDRNFVVYTGTHDNDTTVGWFNSLNDWERGRFLQYLGCTSPHGIHWDLIRLAMSSVADRVVVPLQDIFGLGTEARMNFPGQATGNWAWRYRSEMLTQELSDRLRSMTEIYGRMRR
jgi:4-alpha-glucanotransferase